MQYESSKRLKCNEIVDEENWHTMRNTKMHLHTLRGQYEAIHGELDVVFHKQQQF